MNRGRRILIFLAVLTVVGLVAVGLGQLEPHGVSPPFVMGVTFIVFGVVLTTLHLALSDDFVRRQEWQPGTNHFRQLLRRGWYVTLLGAAILGLYYFDRWISASAA